MEFVFAKNISVLQYSLSEKRTMWCTVTIFSLPFFAIFRIYSLAAFRVRDVDEWTRDGATKDVTLLHS